MRDEVSVPGKKLYVAGIPWETTSDQLRAHFAAAGNIEEAVAVVKDGRPGGFGFVTFTTIEEAENAIKMFDQTELGGRKISVMFARPREERTDRRDGGR